MTDLAIDVVKAMTESIGALAWKEISLIWGFEGQLDKLKKRFLILQILLEEKEMDAKNDSQFVSHLLQEVKDVAYLADNVMDDYDYEIIRRKVELGKNLSCKKKVRNFLTCTNNSIIFRIRMTHKVLEILSKFDDLYKGVEQTKQTREALKQPTTFDNKDTQSVDLDEIRQYIAPASEFVGREEDKEWLLHKMYNSTSNEENLSVIAVVGFGGLGKTTLVRAVYDHEKVTGHFGKKMWIWVSENFCVERILKEMVEFVSPEKRGLTNHDAIIQELQKELKDKKFLLVLDDVWDENKALWDPLKNQLKRVTAIPGSVILVTTRIKNVAMNAGDVAPHELKGLSDEESWALFKQKANDPSPPLTNVGERIVKKCKGVPLAITSIAGLLRPRKSLSEWESIEKSNVWADASSQLANENDPNEFLPSLLLSYHHLPSFSMKQCFAYCAIFPKDRKMEKNELIDLWIAQGFLNKAEAINTTSEMENRGEECFNTLLDISFLQLEGDGGRNVALGIWECKMHDLVHDLATHIFKEDMFFWDGKVDANTIFNHRHLVLNFNREESGRIADKVVNEEIIMQQVRTVNIWSGEPCWDMLKQTRYLRTLIMDGIGIKDELPSIIGESKHLRYLDLSSNSIETLPDSICRLYQLQALILLNTKLRELPRDLHRLVSLKRLEISFCVCQRLPIIDLGRLPHLRGLVLAHFRKVKCIGEEVDDINQSNGITRSNLNRDVKDFFPSLRELRIRDFRKLKTLNLVPSTNATTSVVKSLFPCLEILEIIRCGKLQVVKTSPTLSFESLKILYLEKIDGIEEPVDIIKYHKSGSLTCLIVKSMPEMRSLPEALSYCTRLEILEIERCPKLVCLPAGMNSLVYLKEVSIQFCDSLVSIPDDMFKGSSSLRKLEIESCQKLVCLPAGMNSLVSLKEVSIKWCGSLVSIPDDMFKGSSSLRKLIIHGCERLEKIPPSLAECTSLEDLQISFCSSLKHPITDLSRLHVLVSLVVIQTTSMAAFKLEWIPCLPRLQQLSITLFPVEDEIKSKRRRQFSNEDHIDIDIDNGTSFRKDSLVRLKLWKANTLPRQILQLHLPSLKCLQLSSFAELEGLPDEWMGTLSSLEELDLLGCNNLRFLPSKENLSQLQRLFIYDCPKLEERIMAKDGGLQSEWHKVSHVPFIQINYKTIQDLKR